MENEILEVIVTIDDYSKLLYTNFNNGMSRINDIVNIIQIYIEAFLKKIDKYNSLGENIPTDVIINQLNNALKNEQLPSASYLHGERSCHYTCAMVLYCGSDRLFVAQETFEGVLIKNITEQAGNGGFGYDPIVFLPEYQKTVAQISADEKNAISHRGKAVKALKLIIDNLK